MQFSLLSLLLLCSACAIVAAWIGNRAADYRRQDEARTKVEEAGGSAEVKTAWPNWVARIVGGESWQEVTAVTFEAVGFTTLDGMHGYQVPLVDDATLRTLAEFRQLQSLRIAVPDFADASMQRIGELQSLESLSLPGLKMTDVGVQPLTRLKKLESLDLRLNAISDAALVHLAALTSLESLDIRWTHVTRAGVEQLRKALPNCRIEFAAVDDPLEPSP